VRINQDKGEAVTIALVAVAAVLGVLLFGNKLNPFDRSADPSNRRTASAISGRDIVEITNAVAESEKPVTVKVDRSFEASHEVTDPKLTLGQKIGRFFAGLGNLSLLLFFAGLAICILTPIGGILWDRWKYKHAFKNTVSAVRELDDDTFQKLAPKLAAKQDKRDKVLVDKVKAELH
jgi:hypothetical protein